MSASQTPSRPLRLFSIAIGVMVQVFVVAEVWDRIAACVDVEDSPHAGAFFCGAKDDIGGGGYNLETMNTVDPAAPDLSPFHQLSESRRAWIRDMLIPWCRTANIPSLKKAEMEWGDIAGRVDPQFSLWLWAWSRFPVLYVEGLKGVDESVLVTVTLTDGSCHTGYPDSRVSQRDQLVLVDRENGITVERGPFRLDSIQSIDRTP